jgi:hypothetical protein
MKLYEYAVVLDEKRDKDDEVVEAARILIGPLPVLARDDAQAQLLAASAISPDYLEQGKIDRVTVVVRPF